MKFFLKEIIKIILNKELYNGKQMGNGEKEGSLL